MMSTNNILHPANGKPIIVPSQDMVLGIYYLSQESINKDEKPKGYFLDTNQISQALETGNIHIHSTIVSRFKTFDENNKTVFKKYTNIIGRFLLANMLPKNTNIADLINRTLAKKQISEIIDIVFRFCGQKETVIFCDKLMDLGFKMLLKQAFLLKRRFNHTWK